jgi:hypothetical protein
MPILAKGNSFVRVGFSNESEFEKTVFALADHIFGSKTIYLDIKHKVKGHNIEVVPDGYLLDLTVAEEPKLYIVENEIVTHDPFKHIGIQMLKFVTSFDEDRKSIRDVLMQEIASDKEKLSRLEEGCDHGKGRNIDNYLDTAVYTDFRGLVLIDEARTELYKVLERINANISVLEIKAYKSAEGDLAYEFDSLYEEDEEEIGTVDTYKKNVTNEERLRRRMRRAESDTIVVPARPDGFKAEFLANSQWFSIRIGAAMKERIKFIAAYQIAPISAVTHYAEVKEIKPYKDSGKYIVLFKGPATEMKRVPIRDGNKAPQGPVYTKLAKLHTVEHFDDAIES